MEISNENRNENFTINEINYVISFKILVLSSKINMFTICSVVAFGLIGNALITFVFGQKRFRSNSSNVYLLSLAVNDSLFLIVHFIEDTVKNYERVFVQDGFRNNSTNFTSQFDSLVIALNITDNFDMACRLVNYFRYVLRFISSYVVYY